MTKRLADAVAQKFVPPTPCSLRSTDGIVGKSIADAYDKTLVIEESARIYVRFDGGAGHKSLRKTRSGT